MKKGISEAKVQRMRNIVNKDYTKSVNTQVGYKASEKKVEGDVWEESGKTWTIKNGITQSISKMQSVRDFVKMPLTCPKCGNIMKGQFDNYHWKINKECLGCYAAESTMQRLGGSYELKMKDLFKRNKTAQLEDLVEEFDEWLDTNHTFVTETGDIEDWSGGLNKSEMRSKFKKELLDWKKHLNEM
tara:strand:+ start:236 stop:793 length:558 start_codon:yes stop_codon:yes gene_type:complete